MSAPLNPALISPGSLSSRLGHFKHGAQCIGIFYGIKCYSVNNTHSCFSWISSSLTKRNRNVCCPGTPITGVNLSWPHETTSGILVFLDRNVQGSCHFLQSLFLLFTGNISLLITWLGRLNSGQKLTATSTTFQNTRDEIYPQVLLLHAMHNTRIHYVKKSVLLPINVLSYWMLWFQGTKLLLHPLLLCDHQDMITTHSQVIPALKS